MISNSYLIRLFQRRGMTLLEVLLVIGGIAILVSLLLPPRHHNRRSAYRIKCVSNLKQIALAAKMWARDNNDRFPWEVSESLAGKQAWTPSSEPQFVFRALSDELVTPKLLLCPKDDEGLAKSSKPTNFDALKVVSYFVNLDSSYTNNPNGFLAGDRNLSTNGVAVGSGLFSLSSNVAIGFTAGIHSNQGNIALADGSVLQVSNRREKSRDSYDVQTLVEQMGPVTNRLAIP